MHNEVLKSFSVCKSCELQEYRERELVRQIKAEGGIYKENDG